MYQTMSSDNLPSSSSSIKKPNNNNSKSNRTTISTTDHYQHHVHHDNQQNDSQSSQTSQPHISNLTNNETHIHENISNLSQCLSGGHDMLLQWGQRKRSRCSRMEGRSLTNHITPTVSPPCKNNVYENGGASTSRQVRPKDGVLYAKEAPPILLTKDRNLGDQMGCSNTSSPSKHGATTVTRSGGVGKRSPSKGSSGSIKRVKSNDSLPHNHRSTDLARGSGLENGGGGVNNLAAISQMVVVEGEKSNGAEVLKCPRIYLSLSRKEKEDDFYAMKGTKLPHRPKKRAKAVDRALQYIYPGLWLSDLTRARYEVRERKSSKKVKRKGGLKGLEDMDSESE